MFLFVAKSLQGKGLGGELLDFLLNHTDAKTISLRSSINAHGFYEQYGFHATAEAGEFNGIRFIPMTLSRALQLTYLASIKAEGLFLLNYFYLMY